MSSADLALVTRELMIKSMINEVYLRMPFIEELQKRNQIITKGGLTIDRIVDKEEIDDLAQSYTMKETLTDGAKDTLAKPSFNWKYVQLPLKYDGEVEIQNLNAGSEEQIYDLAEHLAKKGQRGIKLKLQTMLFNNGSTNTTDYNDSGKNFQSLVNALKHDDTYGGLTRTAGSSAAGTNDWWQGADPNGFFGQIASSSQNTAANLTISNLRKWVIPVQQYMEAKEDLMVLMCPTLFNKLKAECESKMVYYPAKDTGNVGFNKMYIDGHQIVDVPYLEQTSTTKRWVFILNLPTWELRINPARNFKVTDFEWQGNKANGFDFYLSRILLAGNFMTWQPNANMFLSNIS